MVQACCRSLLGLEPLPDSPYALVPKEMSKNLEWRENLIRFASSFERKRLLWQLCSRDIYFWCNSFVWTYNPRLTDCPERPFNTYPFQDRAIEMIDSHIGKRDLAMDKSRDMGATWLVLTVFLHHWLFKPMESFMLLSRKQDLVDTVDDPDCLMWKLDFILKHLPAWMVPRLNRTLLMLKNQENGSTIAGDATTGDAAVGGRRTAAFLDEFSRVEEGQEIWNGMADVTNSRIVCGTPWGTGGKFYEIMHGNTYRLRLHWCVHPEKAAGLYLDSKGKERSPWYDNECNRRDRQDIAQNLDIDYLKSGAQFFDSETLDGLLSGCKQPLARYKVEIDIEEARVIHLHEDPRGEFWVWCPLEGAEGSLPLPPKDEYWAGSDISEGSGASNSVTCFASETTRSLSAAFITPNLSPDEFARYSVALAKMFYEARMIWEVPGPGYIFGRKILDLGYFRVW